MVQKFVIACIGPSVSPELMTQINSQLSDDAISTLQIKTLASKYPEYIEITVTSNQKIDPDLLTKKLLQRTTPFNVDIIIQKETDARRVKRLLVMDMDSTLIQVEIIDELAKEAGIGEKVAAITHRAMNGEISFNESLIERVRLLKGLPLGLLKAVYERIPFTPGAKTLLSFLQKQGVRTAVLSGGFDYFTARVKEVLHLDYAYANHLELKNGILTGEITGEIVDGEKKVALMKEIAKKEGIQLGEVIAIGDGANDLPMIQRAGLGIAFNAKPTVRAAARYNITQKSLISILYLLGFSQTEIDAHTSR